MHPRREFGELIETLSDIEETAQSLSIRAQLVQTRVQCLEMMGAWAEMDEEETKALRAYAKRENLEPGEAALKLVRRGLKDEPILAEDE